MIKIDSGPGQINIELMARLRNMGFYMYPCVPNTTAVMQETDQKYGAFKSYFRSNLSDACADRLLYNKPLNFAPWIVGLFVFGGMDLETGVDRYRNAFVMSFTKEKCLAAWEMVGAIPPTRACLNDPQVCRELGDSSLEDNTQIAMLEMQAVNLFACNLLTVHGCWGDMFSAELWKKKAANDDSITVPNTKE